MPTPWSKRPPKFLPLRWWAHATQLLAVLGIITVFALKIATVFAPGSPKLAYLSAAFTYGASAPSLLAFNIWLWRALSNLSRFGIKKSVNRWIAFLFYGFPGAYVVTLPLEWLGLLTRDEAGSVFSLLALLSLVAFIFIFPVILDRLHSRSVRAADPGSSKRGARWEVITLCVAFFGWMMLAWQAHPVIYHVIETDIIALGLGLAQLGCYARCSSILPLLITP